MFNIIYSDRFYLKLDKFINSYKDIYIDLYSDTWIQDENIIINNYVFLWNSLYNTIIWKIDEKINEKLLLWRCGNGDNTYFILRLTNFVIFVFYREDNILNERYIEEIEFYKK